MRPSTIALSLKSWTNKLHPQLPLTNQESSRLLNALTSAFRQKLDEAHPSRDPNDAPKKASSSKTALKTASAFHSSAVHADKHLASVLTNPLLGGRVLDYGTAKVELTKNPHRDPIEVLEEYYQKGAASVAIAELCLHHFRQSIERLPQSKQQAAISQTQPGRRVFKWLLESNLFDSTSYVDNLAFIGHLVHFLVKEGREDAIWSWVKLDIVNNEDLPQSATVSRHKIARKTNLYKYRWRGRVLRSMLASKLGPMDKTGHGPSPDQIHAASDTIFEICELRRSAAPSDHLWWIPMAPISTLFGTLFGRRLHCPRTDLDVLRFEKLYDSLSVICDSAPQITLDIERAKMQLIHPQVSLDRNTLACRNNTQILRGRTANSAASIDQYANHAFCEFRDVSLPRR